MKQSIKPVRIPDLLEMKQRGEKITVLTAYDATMARLLDCAVEGLRSCAGRLREVA